MYTCTTLYKSFNEAIIYISLQNYCSVYNIISSKTDKQGTAGGQ